MRLGDMLWKKPKPVLEDSNDDKWKWFKHCLGALDGTHIKLRVPYIDKARYRNRKGEITTNVLGVCSQDRYFIYVLPGWEGSVADGCVLRDAISRRNGLRVPQGIDPLEDDVEEMEVHVGGVENPPILNIDAYDEWAAFRDNLANEMFNTFTANRTAA
ncbi:uncharacterized protein LOC114755134 [Neltuma alba]|uniref:uncharacterized protein LOC114755134 n=1 Tax=Neltuma alba TaxID=207710 RepID=UPI0010A305CA|nr:uncharacterized protein LOC114755134 [Prosopis alba]